MIIIPAIDIMNGKCVRLTQGNYAEQKMYSEQPLEMAKSFEDAGLSRLHLVDLDGARTGIVKNWSVLEQIANQTSLIIDFSGGLSSPALVQRAFDSGAFYVSIGTMAVKNEHLFSECLTANEMKRFILGADTRDGKVEINGWTQLTAIPLLDLIMKYKKKGISQFICTDINRDGLLQGPSIDYYKKVILEHPDIDLIASGGVTSVEDIGALWNAGCKGVIIGKALYEDKIELKALRKLEFIYSC